MSGPSVRPAAEADLDWIAALAAARPFAARWSRAAFGEELNRPGSVLLACEPAGYALARVEAGELRLLDFVAAEDGRGIGRALWAALAAAGKAAGAARLTLEVSAVNGRALAFYAAAGARVVGRRKKFYDDGADAVLMDLELA